MKKSSAVLLFGAAGLVASAVLLLGGSAAAARSAKHGGGLPVLKLTLNGKSIKVSGKAVSGAVKIVTIVKGEKMGEPTLVRLNHGVGPSAFGKAVAAVGKHDGDLNYLDPYGRLVFNIGAPKGKSSAQGFLPPGNYFALDTQHNGTPPHAYFTIKKSSHPAKLPKPGATIRTIEFAFRGATVLHRGELVRAKNDGFLVHMDVSGRVKNQAAAKKAIRLLLAGKMHKANKLFIGPGFNVGPLSSGAVEQFRVTDAPGVYVQACFMETQDGRDHTRLGMERMYEVKK